MTTQIGMLIATGLGLVTGAAGGFAIATSNARHAWKDGWREGMKGYLAIPDDGEALPDPQKVRAMAPSTRKGLALHIPEVVCTANAVFDADLDMWRTITPEEEAEAAQLQHNLGVGVWTVVVALVLCAGLLLFARHIFAVEESALDMRRAADKAVFAEQQARAAAAERGASK